MYDDRTNPGSRWIYNVHRRYTPGTGKTYASDMDTFNNDQGHECAASGSYPCNQSCMQQLQKGALQIQTTGGVSDSGAGYGF